MTPSAAAAALVLAVFNFVSSKFNQRDLQSFQERLETVKAQLQSNQSKEKARSDYEYEARKRLYEEYEPLIFLLSEASEEAVNHIAALAQMARKGELGPGGAMSKDRNLLRSTIYNLLLPGAIFKIIRSRLTFVDLQVEPSIQIQYLLAKAVCQSFTDDFLIASLGKPLPYNPYVTGWRELRQECPEVYRRQGLPAGRLDNTLNALLTQGSDGRYAIVTYGEFEEAIGAISADDVSSSLGAPRDLFFEFHPESRPVLWRTLIVQVLLYKSISEILADKSITIESARAKIGKIDASQKARFIWQTPGELSDASKGADDPFEAASKYVELKVKSALK